MITLPETQATNNGEVPAAPGLGDPDRIEELETARDSIKEATNNAEQDLDNARHELEQVVAYIAYINGLEDTTLQLEDVIGEIAGIDTGRFSDALSFANDAIAEAKGEPLDDQDEPDDDSPR